MLSSSLVVRPLCICRKTSCVVLDTLLDPPLTGPKNEGCHRDSASQLVPKHRLGLFCDGFVYMGVSRNGGTLKSSILNLFNRIFPHKSSILGYPHLWKSPYVDNKINFIHLSVKSAGTPFCFATLNLSMGIPGS